MMFHKPVLSAHAKWVFDLLGLCQLMIAIGFFMYVALQLMLKSQGLYGQGLNLIMPLLIGAVFGFHAYGLLSHKGWIMEFYLGICGIISLFCIWSCYAGSVMFVGNRVNEIYFGRVFQVWMLESGLLVSQILFYLISRRCYPRIPALK